MAQEDNISPEESAAKAGETNQVPVTSEGPWKNSEDMWTFQNYEDLEKYGSDIVSGKSGSSATVALVIDNESAGLPSYQKNKHYWVLENADFGGSTGQVLYLRHSVEYLSILVEEGSATMEDVNTESNLDFLGSGKIKVNTFQGFPIYIRDPNIDDTRPETQTESTTGATTGTTVTTTTTAKPGAAGVVIESQTDLGTVSNRLDSKGETPSTVTGGRGDGAAEVARRQADAPLNTGEALAQLARGASSTGAPVVSGASGKIESGSPGPCLPQNMGAGSGSTPPASVPYPDAILRQARAAAAAPVAALTSRLDSKGETPTAPTTVTQPPSTPTSSSTAKPRPPNVYIYEPITPGFDRYDFNTGKKVYTPNNGPSRTSSGQPTTPPSSPPSTSPAPIDGGIAVGTTTVASGSKLRQRKEAEAAGRQTGPQ